MDIRHNWWFDVITGFLVLALGWYFFTRPEMAILTIGKVFGLYLLIFGTLYAWGAFSDRIVDVYWYIPLGEGVFYILLSAIILTSPATVLLLNRILGVWLLSIGVFRLLGNRFRSTVSSSTMTGNSLLILFGLFLLVYPLVFASLTIMILGIILILVGGIMIANGISVWKIKKGFY
ncbi:DUF308 domain-containing protein [Clostridia bacterium]|nr:DUF308 domain-containing protein [Clostridia bacterium]